MNLPQGQHYRNKPYNATLWIFTRDNKLIEDGSTKVPLGFFIQLTTVDPTPPIIQPPTNSPPICNTTQAITLGDTLTFDIVASDVDTDDTVSLNSAGLAGGGFLSDENGSLLTASANSGLINVVTSAPTPETLFLVGVGLLALFATRRQNSYNIKLTSR